MHKAIPRNSIWLWKKKISYHRSIVYFSTMSESQMMMWWQLIPEDFGPNIQNISVIENIVADTQSILPSKSANKYEHITSKSQCHAKDLFAIDIEENNYYYFLLTVLNVQREQQKELRNLNYKLSAYILYWGSGYSNQALNNVDIICYGRKIYTPQNLRRCVIDWYHLYLNCPCGSRLAKNPRIVLLESPCHASKTVW